MGSSRSHWALMRSLLAPHRRRLIGFGLVLAAATALPLAGPLLLRAFIDEAAQGAGTGRLATLALVYAGLGVAASGAQVLVSWRATALTWEVTNELRNELADHVLHADLSFFRDSTPGELISRLDGDVSSMSDFIARFVARLLSVGLLGVASVAVVAVVEPVLTIPLVAFLAAAAWVVWHGRDQALQESMAERAAEADVLGFVEEGVAAAEDLASLRAGEYAVGRLAERSEVFVQAAGRRARVQMRLIGTVRMVLGAGEFLMLGVGALCYARGWFSIGTVFLGYRFIAIVRSPVEVLSWQLQDLQGAGGSARRVADLLAERATTGRGTAALPAGPLGVEFDGVALAYEQDEGEVLSELTLTIPAGRRLGLLGRTGSGKTSLTRLLLGFVAPTRGQLRIGGVPVGELDEVGFRRRVTAVPQDVQLFPGTIRDNVTLFDDSVPDEAILTALDAVGLGPWLAGKTDGLATGVAADGEGGLSAGEAQLLSLARVVLRSPDLVVLDEATSRIDPATQALIAAATERLLDGRTAVIIAHRLETLETCDDIAVLEAGRLVEHGDRKQLAADPASHYARLLAAGAAADALGELA